MNKKNVLNISRKWSLVIVIVLLAIFFRTFQPVFLSQENLINILRQASILGVLAMGLTFVVVCGEIDLSFSAIASLSAILMLFMAILQVNPVLSWLLVVIMGLLCGAINAFVIVRLGVPSMLGTIGTQLAIGGLAAWIAKGATIWTAKYSMMFSMPGRGVILKLIPVPVAILLVVSVISLLILEKTVLGRYFYAVGGNASAANHAGISSKKVKAQAFLIMGVLGALGGIIMASQFASATPTVGNTFLFPAVIAVFLGSIFLKDGVPNAWGTLVACIFLSILQNGVNLIGLKYWHENTLQGIIMIVAIGLMLHGKKKRA